MEIAIPLYDRFTALDAVGPYEVLSRLPGARGHVRRRARPARTRPTPACSRSSPTRALDDVPAARTSSSCPAAPARATLLEDERARSTGSARAHETSHVDDVGLHRLAAARRRRAARRPRGHDATGSTLDDARRATARAPTERAGRGAGQGRSPRPGVSSGIDMALALAARDRRRRGRAGDPARHRVRPPAAVRLRLHGTAPRRRSRWSALRSRRATRRRPREIVGAQPADAGCSRRALLYRPGCGGGNSSPWVTVLCAGMLALPAAAAASLTPDAAPGRRSPPARRRWRWATRSCSARSTGGSWPPGSRWTRAAAGRWPRA